MEIYRLSDEVLEGKKRRVETLEDAGDSGGGFVSGELKITDIRQAVRNENRVNVYVNGKYSFSLDVAQVVDMGVKVGRVISEGALAELKKASEFGKAYQRALEWVLLRPRSVRELKDYLRRREIQRDAKEKKQEWEKDREMAEAIAQGEDAEKLKRQRERRLVRMAAREKYDFKDLIMERLCERGYVDDRKFAEYYVENRFVKKGVSRKRLEMELMKKGVSSEIIQEVLPARNDEEEIDKIIAKKWGKYDEDKLISYLCQQGFPYQLAQSRVREYEKG